MRSSTLIDRGVLLVVCGFLALLGAELVLILAIPGINYAGADGKAAQAIVLATLEFAKPFHISNLNPLEGMGSQMMPYECLGQSDLLAFCLFRQAGGGGSF
jgi:hypothetical protein